jgi:hypothetical protein
MFYSSDFKCCRIFISISPDVNGTSVGGLMLFETPKNPVTWWDESYVAAVRYVPLIYANYCSTASAYAYTRINGLSCNLAFGSLGVSSAYGASSIGAKVDYGGAHILSPVFLVSNNSSRPGILGTLYDMWWVSAQLPEGTFIPTTEGSKYLFVINDVAIGSSNGYVSV